MHLLQHQTISIPNPTYTKQGPPMNPKKQSKLLIPQQMIKVLFMPRAENTPLLKQHIENAFGHDPEASLFDVKSLTQKL